jgi:Transposase DDE domain group 1
VILDLDATLVTAHSDKEQAAGTYRHGFGFHPLLCYEATTEEALAGLLRPGNAGANTAADHIELLELALAQVPELAVGPGLLVRADSGGATHAFLDHVVERGLCFSVGFDLTEPVRQAILALPERAWRPALTQAGEEREGAAVAELTLDLSNWPAGTRAICRRERPSRRPVLLHRRQRLPLPGLHHQPAGPPDRPARAAPPRPRRRRGPDPLRQRQRPPEPPLPRLPAERRLARARPDRPGPARLDTTAAAQRRARRCEPKRRRYRLLHVAGRLTRHARQLRLHLPRGWAWGEALLQAFARLRALPQAP